MLVWLQPLSGIWSHNWSIYWNLMKENCDHRGIAVNPVFFDAGDVAFAHLKQVLAHAVYSVLNYLNGENEIHCCYRVMPAATVQHSARICAGSHVYLAWENLIQKPFAAFVRGPSISFHQQWEDNVAALNGDSQFSFWELKDTSERGPSHAR